MIEIPMGGKGWTYILVVFSVIASVAALFNAVNFLDESFTKALGNLIICGLMGWIATVCWRKIRHTGPAMTLRTDGIVFNLNSPTVLPWHALREVTVSSGRFPMILFRFEPAMVPKIVPGPIPQPGLLSRWRGAVAFSVIARDASMKLEQIRELVVPFWQASLSQVDPSLVVEPDTGSLGLTADRHRAMHNGKPLL